MKKINQKAIIRGLAILWFLVAIILMTAANIVINEEFDFITWISNSLILLGIMVFGLLMGENIGEDKTKNIVDGLYQTNLKTYNEIRNAVDEIAIYFPYFYEWYLAIDLKKKKISYLEACGMNRVKAKNIVNYCDFEDYQDLKEHAINKDGVCIKALLEQEREPVYEVLSGKIKLNVNTAPYYLQAFATETSVSVLEQGKKLEKERNFNKKSGRAVKIISSTVISLAMGLLTVKEFMSGNDTQAWVNLVSRITTLFTSLASGWLSAGIDVKKQAEILENKRNILTIFKSAYEKKMFNTLDENQQAEVDYLKYIESLKIADNSDLKEKSE